MSARKAEYFARKEVIRAQMYRFMADKGRLREGLLHFNTLDQPGRGLGGVYLSLLGTSAEDADSGQVGRGNRVNGLIPIGPADRDRGGGREESR